MNHRILFATSLLFVWFGSIGRSTPEQDAKPRFETASIRPNNTSVSGSPILANRPGRFTLSNASVFEMIGMSFGVRTEEIVDAPDWTKRERFDIVAIAPGKPIAQYWMMLRTLLEERFSLRFRREPRLLPIYKLSRIRPDGALGPNLRSVTTDCRATPTACRYSDSGQGTVKIRGREWSIEWLGGELDRRVVDETGLVGQFDIDFNWNPDPLSNSDRASDRPSIFTALQDQLGLKLESSRGNVEVLVIESVQRPTEN